MQDIHMYTKTYTEHVYNKHRCPQIIVSYVHFFISIFFYINMYNVNYVQ